MVPRIPSSATTRTYRVVDRMLLSAEGDDISGYYQSWDDARNACRTFDSFWPDDSPHTAESTLMRTFYYLAYEDEYQKIRTDGIPPLEDGHVHLYPTLREALAAHDWIDTRIDQDAHEEAQRALRSGDKTRYWLEMGKAVRIFTHATLASVELDESFVPVCAETDGWTPRCGDRNHHFRHPGALSAADLKLERIPLPNRFDDDEPDDDE